MLEVVTLRITQSILDRRLMSGVLDMVQVVRTVDPRISRITRGASGIGMVTGAVSSAGIVTGAGWVWLLVGPVARSSRLAARRRRRTVVGPRCTRLGWSPREFTGGFRK